MTEIRKYTDMMIDECVAHDAIDRELFAEYGVKKGLRDVNGVGVLTGLTNISMVNGSKIVDGKKVPIEGELLYRGYNIQELVRGALGRKFIYEEAAYLLLFGELPTKAQLIEFKELLNSCMELPTNFTRDVIMKAPSADIMNSMTRSILTLAAYDEYKESIQLANVLRQSIRLIAEFPMLAAYAYHAYNHYENDGSMYIHRPDPELSLAENFLRMLRPDMSFTELEAMTMDIAFLLHMEHGGGNNSTFTTRVVTSAGSDTYSAIAAAMSSLKGSKHGGANLMVMRMMDDIREHVRDHRDQEEVEDYLLKILAGEAFDHKGLIYGMGHAVYSLSDPRERVFKEYVVKLSQEKKRQEDMMLYDMVETLAPKLIARKRKIFKGVSPNVDFYSGFVYDMMGIPRELYTPIFAIARITGWSAHRMEELVTMDKIIRPAYKSLVVPRKYMDRDHRTEWKAEGKEEAAENSDTKDVPDGAGDSAT